MAAGRSGTSLRTAARAFLLAGLPVSSGGVLLLIHGSAVLSSDADIVVPARLYSAVVPTHLWNHEGRTVAASTAALPDDVMHRSADNVVGSRELNLDAETVECHRWTPSRRVDGCRRGVLPPEIQRSHFYRYRCRGRYRSVGRPGWRPRWLVRYGRGW